MPSNTPNPEPSPNGSNGQHKPIVKANGKANRQPEVELGEEGKEKPTSDRPEVANPFPPYDNGSLGLGGIACPPSSSSLQLLKIFNRGVESNWPVTPELRQEAIDVARDILLYSNSKRLKLTAFKALCLADGLNAKREKISLDAKQGDEKDSREYVRMLLTTTGLRQSMANATAGSIAIESQVVPEKQDTPECQCDSAAVG